MRRGCDSGIRPAFPENLIHLSLFTRHLFRRVFPARTTQSPTPKIDLRTMSTPEASSTRQRSAKMVDTAEDSKVDNTDNP
jgi:hypothetical protein